MTPAQHSTGVWCAGAIPLEEEEDMADSTGKRPRQDEQDVPMASGAHNNTRPRLLDQSREEAIRFLRTMKHRFTIEPVKYNEIIATMRDFNNPRVPTAAVVERLKVLLDGHPDLLYDLNQFLPWKYIRDHGPVGGSGNV